MDSLRYFNGPGYLPEFLVRKECGKQVAPPAEYNREDILCRRVAAGGLGKHFIVSFARDIG